MPNYVDDNIAALATPFGIGAIAVIRVSGKNIDNLIFRLTGKRRLKPRYSTLANISSPDTGETIDRCLVTFFSSPDSYTGEDILEISCHGGEYVPRAILSALYHHGVRAALAGEFSYRAFMNGKIDLLQAESIVGLINSKTSSEASANLRNLSGKLGKKIDSLRKALLDILSLIEHELDFQENEITFTDVKVIINKLQNISNSIHELSSSFSIGKLLSRGIRVPLIGRPNSGKSSLFNAMIGHERAIVSNLPGTTRDTLETWFDLEHFSICLIDTAGYWESDDFLERLGIKRTITEMGRADYLIFIDDVDPIHEFNNFNINVDQDRIIFVKTKCDLGIGGSNSTNENYICTSSKNDFGIAELITQLSTKIITSYENYNENNSFLMTSRQSALLERSKVFINNSLGAFKSGSEIDLLASDLRELVNILDDVVGTITNTEVIDNIFTNFCVGK